MAHKHFTKICSCGTVLGQCRCMSKDKTIITVENGCPKCKAKDVGNTKTQGSQNEINVLIASCTSHRACHSAEHNPEEGRIHGYCIVCGVPWPCEPAKKFM